MFQSSPASKGRCNQAVQPRVQFGRVSILTGLERPVQRGAFAGSRGQRPRFNPHRPRKAGATYLALVQVVLPLPVSILTGLERPVQPDDVEEVVRVLSFNPHRPRKAGATATRLSETLETGMFQSSPASKGRCNGDEGAQKGDFLLFQSSPASKGRCNGTPCGSTRSALCFNPHRPRKAGATNVASAPRRRALCFNPHRPRKAGATGPGGVGHGIEHPGFNPHRPRKAGATARFVKGSGKKS